MSDGSQAYHTSIFDPFSSIPPHITLELDNPIKM